MIEIYGRYSAGDSRQDRNQLHSITVSQSTPVSVVSAQSETCALLGWSGAPTTAVWHSESDGVSTVISGNPRWRDTRLAEIAAKDGHGTALRVAYSEYGDDAVKHIHGSFAVCIVDSRQDRLLLAVDRIGIERLCYCYDEGEALNFATTLTSLKTLRSRSTKISNQALFDFIYFHVIPSPATIYENVRKLEPAQMLTFDGSTTELTYYWSPAFEEDCESSEEELSTELHQILDTVIERYDIDENTGCFLSGGLDSSTVTGLACQTSSKKVDAFTIGFDQAGYDEVAFARAAANHFGANLIEYYVTPEDIAGTVDEIATTYDEPFGNSSAIPALFCARLAAQHGKTHLLAGDGGDELFAGNERYETQAIFEYYARIPNWMKSTIIEPMFLNKAAELTPISRKIRSYIEQAKVTMPERLQTYNTLNRNRISDVFTSAFLETVDTIYPVSEMTRWYTKGEGSDLLNHMLYFDWKLTLADNDIRKVNVMCDHANVRVSYPLLDNDLLDFSTRIPSRTKMRRGQLRRFFRNSMKDFLPREVLEKSKHGFGLPFGEWLKSSPELQTAINPSLDSLADRGIIRKSFIDTMRHKHMHEHATYYGGILWTLVMLERWLTKNS